MGRDVCAVDPMASCFHDCDPCEAGYHTVVRRDKGLIYVAGPYTHPDPVENTHNAIRAGVLLRDAGYCPIIPHLSLLAHMVCPRPPEFWYEWDLRLMDRCDFMLRLPGESWGADCEEEHARELGIAVHHMTAAGFLARYDDSDECLGEE